MENTKKCKKCNRELPKNDTYFFKNKQLKDGLEGSCKECRGSSFVKKKERPIANEGFKVCNDCSTEYPNTLEYFSSDARRKDGLNYSCKKCINARNRKNYNPKTKHEYYIENKKYILEREKKYRINNIEMFKAKEKKYYDENVDTIIKYQQKYRVKNKEKISYNRKLYYENNKEICNKRCREYYENNKNSISLKSKEYREKNKDILKEKNKEYRMKPEVKRSKKISEYKRRTLKKKALSFLTKEQWGNTLKHFNNTCAYCGKQDLNLTLDHFVPLSKGGELSISNVIPCCYSCNASKNNTNFKIWYSKQEFYNKDSENKILDFLKYKDGIQQISIL